MEEEILLDDEKQKAELLIFWLADVKERISDLDDKRIIESTINFLREVKG